MHIARMTFRAASLPESLPDWAQKIIERRLSCVDLLIEFSREADDLRIIRVCGQNTCHHNCKRVNPIFEELHEHGYPDC